MDATDQTIVITGASRGLGAGLAETLHAQGARLALCSRSAPVLEDGERVLAAEFDVRDASAVARFAKDAVSRFGRIDLWINNAGVLAPIAPLRDLDLEEARTHVEINLLGLLACCQVFVRHVRGREGGGALINISSGAARKPYSGWSVYCAAKAAVDRLTECIDLEERDQGLRAFSVAPGVIDTYMQALIRSTDEADFPDLPRFVAMKREGRYNTPAFIAERLLELAFGKPGKPGDVLASLPNEWETR
ncbi:MAG: SDR family NAD(P)-dependent oxidoreductase [Deltaproteobacteria bacterium]|nr:SDR family NAD(P)-dependent oxidoreductase [Deltaproteobacteria bacterium]